MMISRKMNAKCCHLSATRKASLYLLAVLSAMGLLSTLYIAATAAAAASSSSGGDAPSFDAPSSSLPPAEEGAARRNLSEDATSTTMGNSTIEDGEAARRRRETFLATAKDDAPLLPSPTDDAGHNNRTGLLRGQGQPRVVEEKPPEQHQINSLLKSLPRKLDSNRTVSASHHMATNDVPIYTEELAKLAVRPSSWQCVASDDEDPKRGATNDGTVFAFIHVYKTAGSTMRKFFHELAYTCHKTWVSLAKCTGVLPSSIQSRGPWKPCMIEEVADGRG